MSTRWYVAKHVADLERNEPVNIGVIVDVDGDREVRFLGQDGPRIDGRKVWRRMNVDAYRMWFEYWRTSAVTGEDLSQIVTPCGDRGESYRLEPGGEVLLGELGSASALSQTLFERLVAAEPTSLAESPAVSDPVELLMLDVERELGTLLERDTTFQVPLEGVADVLEFDYRYDNGRPHLMKRIDLVARGAWERTHAASWAFTRVVDGVPNAACIALLPRMVETGEVEQRLRVLEKSAYVIDTSAPDAKEDLLYAVSR